MRVSVLWTGGKDSALALHEAAAAGHEIANLATFVPPASSFLAHPISLMGRQAEAMGFAHHAVTIREPYRGSYEKAILGLRDRFGIEGLVTGDIAEADGRPNWIAERGRARGLRVLTPLWGWERLRILERLFAARFWVIFSCVKEPWFDESWLGRPLDASAVPGLLGLRERLGLDLCGEQGEYHTMTLDGPGFKSGIVLGEAAKLRQGRVLYLKIGSLERVRA